jgi:hypothetical protein
MRHKIAKVIATTLVSTVLFTYFVWSALSVNYSDIHIDED